MQSFCVLRTCHPFSTSVCITIKEPQALDIQSFYWGSLLGMIESFATRLNSISIPSLPALSSHSNARLRSQANICGSKHSPLITWFIFPTWPDPILRLSRGPTLNHFGVWRAQLHSRNQGHNPAKLFYNNMFLSFCSRRFVSYIYY